MHDVSAEKRDRTGKWTRIYASDLSTSDSRRSPEVSPKEFDQYAARGSAKMSEFEKGLTGPEALTGARFKRVTDDAYAATREPWGGVTVDSHTGEHVPVNADKYALTVRKDGVESVTVAPTASREDFDTAMDTARTKFAHELSFPGAHLGVFHDADLDRIDIDPVLVTPSLADVHDIGAFTRATGGAYHFKSGDGFWPPHVKGGKTMSLSITTPMWDGEVDLSARDGQLAYWKQILPMKTIHYTAKDGSRQTLNFDRQYLTDLASATAVDEVGFLLADKDNAHTMDPERWRGKVEAMEVRANGDPELDGLWGKIVFPTVEAAKAVIDNPKLGVSARIREGVARSDGSTVSRGIIHVLGTLDPQVSGMSPWQPTDLSNEDDTLDLSDEEYEDMSDKTKTPEDLKAMTEAEMSAYIDGLDEDALDAFLTSLGLDPEDYTGDEPGGAKPDDKTKTDEPVLATAGADMSHTDTRDIELANARAEGQEALRRVAAAEWKSERGTYMDNGVPAAALDLAAPVLNRASDMVIDLSNHNEDDVNVSEVVRGLLDALKGTVDLSTETGHYGTHSGEDNPDAETLGRWHIDG